jgi:hypothetical protein
MRIESSTVTLSPTGRRVGRHTGVFAFYSCGNVSTNCSGRASPLSSQPADSSIRRPARLSLWQRNLLRTASGPGPRLPRSVALAAARTSAPSPATSIRRSSPRPRAWTAGLFPFATRWRDPRTSGRNDPFVGGGGSVNYFDWSEKPLVGCRVVGLFELSANQHHYGQCGQDRKN